MRAFDFFSSARFQMYIQSIAADLDDSIKIIESHEKALGDVEAFFLDDATEAEREFMQPFIIERLLNLVAVGAYVSNFEYLLGMCSHGKVH